MRRKVKEIRLHTGVDFKNGIVSTGINLADPRFKKYSLTRDPLEGETKWTDGVYLGFIPDANCVQGFYAEDEEEKRGPGRPPVK